MWIDFKSMFYLFIGIIVFIVTICIIINISRAVFLVGKSFIDSTIWFFMFIIVFGFVCDYSIKSIMKGFSIISFFICFSMWKLKSTICSMISITLIYLTVILCIRKYSCNLIIRITILMGHIIAMVMYSWSIILKSIISFTLSILINLYC